jgi:hypothetical protein
MEGPLLMSGYLTSRRKRRRRSKAAGCTPTTWRSATRTVTFAYSSASIPRSGLGKPDKKALRAKYLQ